MNGFTKIKKQLLTETETQATGQGLATIYWWLLFCFQKKTNMPLRNFNSSLKNIFPKCSIFKEGYSQTCLEKCISDSFSRLEFVFLFLPTPQCIEVFSLGLILRKPFLDDLRDARKRYGKNSAELPQLSASLAQVLMCLLCDTHFFLSTNIIRSQIRKSKIKISKIF